MIGSLPDVVPESERTGARPRQTSQNTPSLPPGPAPAPFRASPGSIGNAAPPVPPLVPFHQRQEARRGDGDLYYQRARGHLRFPNGSGLYRVDTTCLNCGRRVSIYVEGPRDPVIVFQSLLGGDRIFLWCEACGRENVAQ